jgi:hypothetical protein
MPDTAADVLGKAPTFTYGDTVFEFPTELPYEVTRCVAKMKRARVQEEKARADGNETALEDAGFSIAEALDDLVRTLFAERYEEFMAMHPSMAEVMGVFEVLPEWGIGLGESQASES